MYVFIALRFSLSLSLYFCIVCILFASFTEEARKPCRNYLVKIHVGLHLNRIRADVATNGKHKKNNAQFKSPSNGSLLRKTCSLRYLVLPWFILAKIPSNQRWHLELTILSGPEGNPLFHPRDSA